jgi:S1-C subfamily serine protease
MDDQPTTPIPETQPHHHMHSRSRRCPIRAGIAALAGTAILGVSGLAYATQPDSTSPTTASTQMQLPTEGRPGGQTTILPLDPRTQDPTTDATTAQEAGLVYINTTIDYGRGQAAGTGMILTSDGEILTNHHVIEGATSITVQLVSTGQTYDAEAVGYDSTHDVAVLQLENASGLTTVRTDTSGDVQVGDQVTGVGNANGDGGAASAAAGTVSALDQSITVQSQSGGAAEKLGGLIEVSANIIAGDSGGALYDPDGEVIGMNTAASSGDADVTGYAVPIAQALTIAEQIGNRDENGSVHIAGTGFLGVQMAASAGPVGTLVAGAVDGAPAESAGISDGSRITALNGSPVSSAAQLSEAVAIVDPGTSVSVSWTDPSGMSHTATVTLAAGPIG